MSILVGIPSYNLPECWIEVRHLVESACARSSGKYQAVDILKCLIKGSMQLWAATDENKVKSIAITEIAKYPNIKVARLLAATGEDSDDISEHMPSIEKWAKDQSCEALEVICRSGWSKMLKPQGYNEQHRILEKTLI